MIDGALCWLILSTPLVLSLFLGAASRAIFDALSID